ncbi:MAG: hypothetical protein EOP37_15975 [Rubrivivax sp.]|nr:MAG: hypothetical protein EOP37_15975 [Rubrivivax sp.]
MAAPQDRPDPRRIPDVPDPGGAAESIEALTLRIEMAELRVVRRDLEFQLHWDALQQRSKAVMTPGRWLLPALGTGASWLFWRLLRGKRHRRARDHHHGQPRGRSSMAGLQALFRSLTGADHDSGPASAARPAAHGDHRDPGSERPGRPELGTLQLLTVLWGLMPTTIRGRIGPEITQLVLGVVAGFMQGRKKQSEEAREHER